VATVAKKTMINGRISGVQKQKTVINERISGVQTQETVMEGSVVSSRLAHWSTCEV